MVEAQQALRLGEAACGPGHASTLAQLCIRQFASLVAEDPTLRELRARLLGPMIAHDQAHKNELLSTLQTYLDTGCKTVQTAELLGVHRNSVLYRLQRIVELAHVDLEDADTRLLLQFALLSAEPGAGVRERYFTPRAAGVDVVWSRPEHTGTATGWIPEVAFDQIKVGS
jgi:purine catabolism regulator